MEDFLLDLPPEKDLRSVKTFVGSSLETEKFNMLLEYVKEIRCESKAAVYSYIRLGQIFTDIQDKKLYYFCLVGGIRYEDFFAFMYVVFGFRKSTVYNLMTIYKRFSTQDCKIMDEYAGYSYSQLVELVPLVDDEKKMARVDPGMTVSELRELKQLWKEDGFNETARDWKDELQTGRERHAQASYKEKREKRKEGILALLNSDKGEVKETAAKPVSEAIIKPTVADAAGKPPEVKKLNFANDKERKDFIKAENCQKWELYIDIPALSLQYRRFIFANGDSLIAEFGHCYPNYQTDPNKVQEFFRLHLQTKKQSVFNCEGIAPTYVVKYMQEHKDEI